MDTLTDFAMMADRMKVKLKGKKARAEYNEKYKKFKNEEKKMISYFSLQDYEWKKSHPDVPKDYDVYYKDNLGLKKLEHHKLSHDELKNSAKRSLGNRFVGDERRIVDKYKNQSSDIRDDIDGINNRAIDKLIDIDREAKKSKLSLKNRNLMSGIMKSSVSELMEDELARGARNDSQKVVEDRNKLVAEKEETLRRLEADRDNAKAKLDLKKVDALNRQIDKLKNDDDIRANRVRRYNDSVDAKEAQYLHKKRESMARLENIIESKNRRRGYAEKKGIYTDDERHRNAVNRYHMALDLYNQMPKSVAYDAIDKNEELRYYLGEYYYDLLITKTWLRRK